MTQELFSEDTLQGRISISGSLTTTTPAVKAVAGARQLTAFLQVIGTVTAGEVILEHNEVSATYTGTWYPFKTVTAAELVALSGGGVVEPWTWPGLLCFLRWRINVQVDGGGSVVGRITGLRP